MLGDDTSESAAQSTARVVARLRLPIAMHDEVIGSEFDEPGLLQRGDDGSEMVIEQGDESVVRDVSSGDDEQAARRLPKEVAVAEVPVLGDDDAVLSVGKSGDLGIGGAVAVR